MAPEYNKTARTHPHMPVTARREGSSFKRCPINIKNTGASTPTRRACFKSKHRLRFELRREENHIAITSYTTANKSKVNLALSLSASLRLKARSFIHARGTPAVCGASVCFGRSSGGQVLRAAAKVLLPNFEHEGSCKDVESCTQVSPHATPLPKSGLATCPTGTRICKKKLEALPASIRASGAWPVVALNMRILKVGQPGLVRGVLIVKHSSAPHSILVTEDVTQ